MARKQMKTWVIVALALVSLGVMGFVAVAGAGVYFFNKHIDIDTATQNEADLSFDEVRARFAGGTPLVVYDKSSSRPQVNRNPRERDRTRPETLRILVWDASDERLVNLSLPLWVLRLGDDEQIDIDVGGGDALDDLDLTMADIDRFGRGLIYDHDRPGDERVLVWTE